MNNPELFNTSINRLLWAYLNDQFEHKSETRCAVAHLIYHPGSPMVYQPENYNWADYLANDQSDTGLQEILYTGYTVKEIILIEKAFESYACFEDKDGYKGLMAVVDCLLSIHHAEPQQAQTIKQRFLKPVL